jgi:hypothetical protein
MRTLTIAAVALALGMGAAEAGTATKYHTEVRLELRGHLEARVILSAAEDPDNPPLVSVECIAYRTVKVQRKQGSSWETVATESTGSNDRVRVDIEDAPGLYRALAPRHKQNDDGNICLKGVSDSVRHRHRAGG